MSTPTVERTGDWDSVPFGGGYAGLHDLAAEEFSGMVTAGPARLFMLRGKVVGILDGSMEDFESASGTAREAPHPALPLLAVMQERTDEVRAQYYTEETAMSDVDRTLADGNFTGFIELSENVLSGDYYQVYHQGHSMSVAFVGAAERLIVDDEAFEQADDEVGIYEVRPVDVTVIEIPEPADDATETDDTTAAATSGAAAGTAAESTAEQSSSESESAAAAAGTDSEETADGETDDASEPADDVSSDPADAPQSTETAGESDGTDSAGDESDTDDASSSPQTGGDAEAGPAETTDADVGETVSTTTASTEADTSNGAEAGSNTQPVTDDAPEPATAPSKAQTDSTVNSESDAVGSGVDGEDQTATPAPDHPAASTRSDRPTATGASGEGAAEGGLAAGNLEMRSLPSLDPARTASKSRQERQRRSTDSVPGASRSRSQASNATSARDRGGASGTADQPTPSNTQTSGEPETSDTTDPEDATTASTEQGDTTDGADDRSAGGDDGAGSIDGDASEALEAAREEAERLESELADLRENHETVVAERDRLESELADARAEIDRLQARLEDAADQATATGRSLSPREAIDETNLFIRYDSKGEATLENAHGGTADKAAVDENMRVEYHTSFDAADAAVDGIDFDTFLTDTVQYRFVDWLVRALLYEIRDTDNTGPMGDLYDALPKVDRAELNGQVSVKYSEDGSEHRSQVGFDVIVRDRMGNPLFVANLNDSRDPATESMMTDLVRAAERVGESSPSLAGAFLVTRSFFAPEALETAEEATAGGLLNRGKQKSFVNLSRKGGYHLCLVEARNQEFHLAVPEL